MSNRVKTGNVAPMMCSLATRILRTVEQPNSVTVLILRKMKKSCLVSMRAAPVRPRRTKRCAEIFNQSGSADLPEERDLSRALHLLSS